jgi:hypothetical protein
LKWKAKGYQLNEEERARLQAEQAIKIQQRELVRIPVKVATQST